MGLQYHSSSQKSISKERERGMERGDRNKERGREDKIRVERHKHVFKLVFNEMQSYVNTDFVFTKVIGCEVCTLCAFVCVSLHENRM